MLKGAPVEDIDAITNDVMARWGAFVREGNPGFPVWSAVDRNRLHIDRVSHVAAS
jgi:hypothetical protein